MRSLEFKSDDDRYVEFSSLASNIGQSAFAAPSVFGFYGAGEFGEVGTPWQRPGRSTRWRTRHRTADLTTFQLTDYMPPGKVSDALLVSPESELLSAPYIMGYLNGVNSLFKAS